jgi:hypothetical protein
MLGTASDVYSFGIRRERDESAKNLGHSDALFSTALGTISNKTSPTQPNFPIQQTLCLLLHMVLTFPPARFLATIFTSEGRVTEHDKAQTLHWETHSLGQHNASSGVKAAQLDKLLEQAEVGCGLTRTGSHLSVSMNYT